MQIALIGIGYWGKNLLRNIVQNPRTQKVWVCDKNTDICEAASNQYRIEGVANDIEDILNNPEIDAVVIATPTSTHFDIAKRALTAGKHVFVEKPATTSSAEIQELIAIADREKRILMTDHIYLYHPAVLKLKEFVADKAKMGALHYIDSTRINLGIYQNDVNVLWDLACHDIAIINFLIEEKPLSVRAIGRINPTHGMEDLVYLFLHYKTGLMVHINASWASPVKIRKMILGGEKQMLIYDDVEPTNKLTLYDYEQAAESDIQKSKLADYRLGNAVIPKFPQREALEIAVDAFYDSIQAGVKPLADGNNAAEVIRILESAQQSLLLKGETIFLA